MGERSSHKFGHDQMCADGEERDASPLSFTEPVAEVSISL
jgi:hypothetical protein